MTRRLPAGGDDAGVGIFRSKKVAKKPLRLTSELALFVLLAVVLGAIGWNLAEAEMKLRKDGVTADGTVVRVLGSPTRGGDDFLIRFGLPGGRKAEGKASPYLDNDLKVGQSVKIRYFPAQTTRVWTEDRNSGVWLPVTFFAAALASLVVGRWRNARRA
ncbi:hypothetical protein OG394_34750 [Kribbella sp. NBC_01245]|uniref:hypothetical protein n=1 Tax=Kribbella sp. NBC_01245 TaxID=2903578 RepID=UPI002E2C233B|nr:hypothetical protein [Kribbella sp. NBC_01245]